MRTLAIPDELLTAAEVADRLRVAETTIKRWQRAGRLPGAVRLSHQVVRFSWPVLAAAVLRGELADIITGETDAAEAGTGPPDLLPLHPRPTA